MSDAVADLEDVLEVLVQLASGDYTARGTPSGTREDFAALMLGVNMLGEELEASRAELERRVEARTATLAQLNQDVMALAAFSNRLQRCATTQEALEAARGIGAIFPRVSGALYLRTDTPDSFAQLTAWGPHAPPRVVLDAGGGAARAVDTVPFSVPPAGGAHEPDAQGNAVRSSWCAPLTAGGQLFGILRLRVAGDTALADAAGGDGLVHLATAAAEITALALANLDLREALWTKAMRDPLTGLYNRRFVNEWSAGELSRTDRAGASLGVVLVDIDRFKQVNDEHGHQVGDAVLQAVAAALRGALRPGDIACRYGGEEFVMLLTFIDPDTLVARAEDMRSRVAAVRGRRQGVPLPPVTVSLGVALYPQHGDSFVRVLAAADAALYRAKQGGRDRVEPAAAD